jgi:acetyl-CoA/propionyl-CoA carboxylase biotin carboxyl carrier protein
MRHPCFVAAETCHGVVESKELAEQAAQLSHMTTMVTPQPDDRVRAVVLPIELDGKRFEVRVLGGEPPHAALARARRERGPGHGLGEGVADAIISPMQGTILGVRVAEGDEVAAGDVVCIVEAMKMENEIAAHRPGIVSELSVAAGQPVTLGQVICIVKGAGDPAAD